MLPTERLREEFSLLQLVTNCSDELVCYFLQGDAPAEKKKEETQQGEVAKHIWCGMCTPTLTQITIPKQR